MLYVDRIEEEIVVCEDENGRMVCIDMANFDTQVREGDCVVPNGDRYAVDVQATKARRAAVRKRFGGLFRRKNQEK